MYYLLYSLPGIILKKKDRVALVSLQLSARVAYFLLKDVTLRGVSVVYAKSMKGMFVEGKKCFSNHSIGASSFIDLAVDVLLLIYSKHLHI